MKLKIIVIGIMMVLGTVANIPLALATQETGHTELRDLDMDRGTDRASNPFGKLGLDDEWGDVDPDDMKELAEGLRKASPEDFQAAINLLLNPDVSLEDAVAAILFVLADGMDEEIKNQAEKVEQLQNGGGPQRTPEASNIDLEMEKLKQQTDRRERLFETVRQTTEKYDETAKAPIQQLRN